MLIWELITRRLTSTTGNLRVLRSHNMADRSRFR
uniref:Uncharacterized protein n=1 Tax=Arundo donax TaxID=35708 RepID=A0A0A9AVG7_ARUDO